MVRAIRGATTVSENAKSEILEATKELLTTILKSNNLTETDLISIIFTVTPDLDQAFPAAAARELGMVNTPLLDAVEINVPGSLSQCIRVLIHCNTPLAKNDIKHIYLHKAQALRRDLVKED